MTQWYVKDLSKITDVSVQTLHHYDRIGLLKPSLRAANGYRIYSEKDLQKLQQIIALKFFGFGLTEIKKMLSAEVDVFQHFAAQSKVLAKQAHSMHEASKTLQKIISDFQKSKSIPWETIIKSIEVYNMTQKIENKWVANAFNQDELKAYVSFEQELKEKTTPEQMQKSAEIWYKLVKEVEDNVEKDPKSPYGIDLGRRCMEWVNSKFGKHVEVRNAYWEKGFVGGHFTEHGLSAKGIAWMGKAIDCYHHDRGVKILSQIGKKSDAEVIKQWNDFMTELCGNDRAARKGIEDIVMADPDFSPASKEWLKKMVK